MMLTEETPVGAAVLPVQVLRDHLRLGSGFADDGMQDALLEAYLRAALAAIEGRIGKVLPTRTFRWVLEDWRDGMTQPLPVGPVQAMASVVVFDGAGVAHVVPPEAYRLVADVHRPRLVARGMALPAVAQGGRVEMVFTAGFGAVWGDVPADLRQAVLLLAAEYYEQRDEMGLRTAALPFGVTALIERWRTVRVLGGGA